MYVCIYTYIWIDRYRYMYVCMYNCADACIADTGHWRRVAKGRQRTAGRCRPLQPLPIRCTSIRCNGASTAKPLTFARSTPPTRRLNASPRKHGDLVCGHELVHFAGIPAAFVSCLRWYWMGVGMGVTIIIVDNASERGREGGRGADLPA